MRPSIDYLAFVVRCSRVWDACVPMTPMSLVVSDHDSSTTGGASISWMTVNDAPCSTVTQVRQYSLDCHIDIASAVSSTASVDTGEFVRVAGVPIAFIANRPDPGTIDHFWITIGWAAANHPHST